MGLEKITEDISGSEGISRLVDPEDIILSSRGEEGRVRYLSSYLPEEYIGPVRYFCSTYDRGISFLIRSAMICLMKDREEIFRVICTKQRLDPAYPPKGIFRRPDHKRMMGDGPHVVNAYVRDVRFEGRYVDLVSFADNLSGVCGTSRSFIVQDAVSYFFHKLNEKQRQD